MDQYDIEFETKCHKFLIEHDFFLAHEFDTYKVYCKYGITREVIGVYPEFTGWNYHAAELISEFEVGPPICFLKPTKRFNTLNYFIKFNSERESIVKDFSSEDYINAIKYFVELWDNYMQTIDEHYARIS